jgi:hypothetical protein
MAIITNLISTVSVKLGLLIVFTARRFIYFTYLLLLNTFLYMDKRQSFTSAQSAGMSFRKLDDDVTGPS